MGWLRNKLGCKWLGHLWVYSKYGGRRACHHCKRREYQYDISPRGRYSEWREHTFPLDGNPKNDKSPIYTDTGLSTIGTEHVLNEIFASVFSKKEKTPEEKIKDMAYKYAHDKLPFEVVDVVPELHMQRFLFIGTKDEREYISTYDIQVNSWR